MKPLVFSVEDDINIQNVIQIALSNSNFEVKVFNNAKLLFQQLETEVPNLFLLDIMLPDMDGIQILKKLKNDAKLAGIPVMIISAKVSEIDRVIGLDSGADDYLIKPFGVLELVSRAKALLRRFGGKAISDNIVINDLEMDKKHYTCKYRGNEMNLTRKQFELLYLFAENNNEIITREEIMDTVWGYDFVGESRTIDVHIKEIRKKLSSFGADEQIIETIRGIGYRLKL